MNYKMFLEIVLALWVGLGHDELNTGKLVEKIKHLLF